MEHDYEKWAAMNLPKNATAEDAAALISRESLVHEELVAVIRLVNRAALEKAERFERDWYDAKAEHTAALRDVRREALEECARIADTQAKHARRLKHIQWDHESAAELGDDIANDIRALAAGGKAK